MQRYWMVGWKCYKGKHWMVQLTDWAGPINFGVHFSFLHTDVRYVDIHLPYCVISLGEIHKVEYPPESGCASKDMRTGVRYKWR